MIDLFNSIESIINQIISPLNWVMLFLIIGGGNIGFNLAKNIEETLEGVRVKIVEKDKTRAEFLANELFSSLFFLFIT